MKKKYARVLICFFIASGAWILLSPLAATRLIIEKPFDNADSILVLAGSSAYQERTEKAAQLFQQGIAPRILLTDDGERGAWSVREQRNMPYVELARKNLISYGIPADKIETLNPQVSGTIDEADALMKKARAENLQKVLLVTSAYHTRRTLRTFEKHFAGGGVETELGIVSVPVGGQTPQPFFWWTSVRGWNLVAGEYVKSAVYWVYY
jgi:uncharacterized SAM-binding protein YcdF (DUF218 family)